MRVLLFVVSFAFSALAALADGSRVALVIGNGNYDHVSQLKNPTRDATDIGAALDRLGFEVTTALDLTYAGMARAVGTFARKAASSDMALIYYAGHGVEVERRNFLLPTDADIRQSLDLDFQALDLQTLLRGVGGAKSLRLVLLDACRDNPFGSQFAEASRSVGRGLSEIEPPSGIIVGYAARGGTVAYDGQGDNSPYAAAILEHLETPGVELGKLFRKVRDSVLAETSGRQEPFTYGSLSANDIFLAGKSIPSDAVSDFAKAQSNGTVEAWDQFISRYEAQASQSALVVAARRLRDVLATPEPDPTPAPQVDAVVNGFQLPAVTAEGREEQLALDKDQLEQVQVLMSELGYAVGMPDGVFGPRSRAALKVFQEDEDFEPTGYLDQRVLVRMRDLYEATPANLDGEWQLALIREDFSSKDGHDFRGRKDTMALATLQITGRRVEVISSSNMSSAPNPSALALRTTLNSSGRLDLSFVLNYIYFKNNSRRVAASVLLPKRVQYDRVFEARGGRLQGNYFAGVELRRLDPNRPKEIWE